MAAREPERETGKDAVRNSLTPDRADCLVLHLRANATWRSPNSR